MRSRGLVVVLALILAVLATVGVFLYSRGVKNDALEGGSLITVIVSKVDIPANSDLNTLIRDNQFVTLDVPEEAVVRDAITQVSQLQNRRNNAFILAGEQIPISRVQGGQVQGGVIGIPEGHQAISVALDLPRAVGAAVAGGDNVTIYATFEDVEILDLDRNFQVRAQGPAPQTPDGQPIETPKFDTTVVLVPEVEVLRVIRPQQASGVAGQSSSEDTEGTVSVTLAFLPQEAQNFVFALEQGNVYLSLLPPDEAGVDLEPITVAQILLPGGRVAGGGQG